MIETRDLTKRFGDRFAVDALDLVVPAGSALGILGANGAGKSTLLRLLMGLTRPTSGDVRVLGYDPVTDPIAVKRDVAWVPESKLAYPRMRVEEFVRFYTHFYPDADPGDALATLVGAVDNGARVEHLSSGQRTRVLLATVLARRPRLLLLDEPAEGLDPLATQALWQTLVERLASLDAGLVLATHRVEDIERLCDRVAILDHGALVVHEDLEDLRNAWRRVHLSGPQGPSGPETWPGIVERREVGSGVELIADTTRGFPIHRLDSLDPTTVTVHPMNLREIYTAIAGHESGGDQ